MPAGTPIAAATAARTRHAPQASRRVRVAIVERHALMRHALRRLLAGETDVDVVAEHLELESLGDPAQLAAEVLVLDLAMVRGSTAEALAQIREQWPDTRIVALSLEDSPAFAHHALAAGATAFVVKDRADTELIEAIRCAARGAGYVSPPLASALRERPRDEPPRGGARSGGAPRRPGPGGPGPSRRTDGQFRCGDRLTGTSSAQPRHA